MQQQQQVRRPLWWALAGLTLALLGLVWDRVWHATREEGDELAGADELVQAHWLILTGVAVMFASLAVAAWYARRTRHAATLAVWVAFVGSAAQVIGLTWDSVRHVQGGESDIAHTLAYGGLLLVVGGLVIALVRARRAEER